MKENIRLLSITLLIFIGISCTNSTNTSSNEISSNLSHLASYKFQSNLVTNICTGDIAANDVNSRTVIIGKDNNIIETLTYINNNQVKPIIFSNSKGESYTFALEYIHYYDDLPSLVQLTNSKVIFRYDTIYKIKRLSDNQFSVIEQTKCEDIKHALLDCKVGEFYDFSKYSIRHIKAYKNFIFAYGNDRMNRESGKTLFKIDASTLNAIPLNTSTDFPLDQYEEYFDILDDDYIILSNMRIKDKNLLILDINGIKKPKKLKVEYLQDMSHLKGTYEGFPINNWSYPLFIQDNKGGIHMFKIGYIQNELCNATYLTGKISIELNDETNTALVKVTELKEYITNFNQSQITNCFSTINKKNCSLTNSERFFDSSPYSGIKLYKDNELFLAFHNSNFAAKLSFVNDNLDVNFFSTPKCIYDDCLGLEDDYIYMLKDMNLIKFNYKNQSSTEIHNGKYMVPSFTIIGDSIIYSSFLGKTNVGTFKIPKVGGTPIMISQYETNLRQLIKLDF